MRLKNMKAISKEVIRVIMEEIITEEIIDIIMSNQLEISFLLKTSHLLIQRLIKLITMERN
jgi:hypothetical protein